MIEFIVTLLFLFILVWLYVLLPANMASRRGRSSVVWVLVAVFFSPILAIILLWILVTGPDQNAQSGTEQKQNV